MSYIEIILKREMEMKYYIAIILYSLGYAPLLVYAFMVKTACPGLHQFTPCNASVFWNLSLNQCI
jgi:hypothetical protein